MSPKRTAAVAFSFAVPVLVGAFTACNKKPTLSFSLDVPSDVASRAAWYEIGAFAGTTCPPSSQFAAGLPAGSAARVSFAANTKNPPGIDTLSRGTYVFAGVVRADDCGVIGVGCTVVDVASADAVAIPVRLNDPPTGACAGGSICQNAQCITSSDNDDPSIGANCSLDLLGAGPFADPYQPAGILTSAPVVVAAGSGFVVGYREYDPNLGEARLALLPVDASGGPGPIHFETLETCADVDESDALGMAFAGDNAGLVVSARPNCAGSGGFDLFEIANDTTINPGGYGVVTSDIGTSNITLSNAHAVAPASTGGFYVAFSKDGQALLNVEQNADLGNTSTSFGGAPPQMSSQVTATDKIYAVLATAAHPDSTGTTGDAGKDSGTGMGGDAGTGSVFRLNVVGAGTDPSKLGTPIEMPGSWASFSAQGSRVFVATAGDDTLPVQFYGFDLGTLPDPAVNDGFAVNTSGTVTYADIAFHNDTMFFAVESPGAISLVSYLHASTTPKFGREIVLGENPRIPSLRGLRDGRVAVAASDTRVAVVWSTGRELGPDDAVGGYAIFACR